MTRRFDNDDGMYMNLAADLALKGAGSVNPNPLVGALIVKSDRIIGRGFHEKYGEPHAERNAIKDAGEEAKDSVMYVTLEPCCHHGKTPPCTEAIIEAGISKVVVGAVDPNPFMSGKGIAALQSAGIEVAVGIEKERCMADNEIFNHYITEGRPFVLMKYAMTLDGKIASHTEKSQWITGEEARLEVHKTRNRYAAVMVGSETVIKDDPMLNCRIAGGRNPVRIICDGRNRIPLSSRIVCSANEIPTIIAVTAIDDRKTSELGKAGCEVVQIKNKNGHIDLLELMKYLGAKKIDSVLLEGGAEMNYSALRAGIVNKINAYIAPKILGGFGAKTPVAGLGYDDPNDCCNIMSAKIKKMGKDYLLEGYVYRNY